MAKNKLAIYATEELINDFKKLLSLNHSQLKLFKDTFKKEESFDFDEDLIEKYLNDVKIDVKKFLSISAVVKYIYKYILKNSISSNEFKSELKLLSEKAESKLTDNKLKILVDLFYVSDNLLEEYADSPYLTSVIPNLSSTVALFDLRAIYKNPDSNEVKTLKPISIIRLETEDDKDNKDNFRFQTDLQGLDKFIEYLKTYRDKLSSLEELSKQIEK